jgi:hypothetical protein
VFETIDVHAARFGYFTAAKINGLEGTSNARMRRQRRVMCIAQVRCTGCDARPLALKLWAPTSN